MTSHKPGAATLRRLKETLYSGPVKSWLERSGLEPYVRSVYHTVLLYTLEDIRVCEVAGVSAKYHITTIKEHARLSDITRGEPVLENLLTDIRPDDNVYDIGANIGRISCLISQKLKEGTLVSFEPQPDNNNRLRENLSLNDANAITSSVALSDENGEVELNIENPSAGAGDASLSNSERRNKQTVDMKTGDELIESGEVPPPTFVHMDVEGAELKVIRGLEAALKSDECQTVYCSVHCGNGNSLIDYGDTPQELHDTLVSYGFELEKFEHSDPTLDNYYLRATK